MELNREQSFITSFQNFILIFLWGIIEQLLKYNQEILEKESKDVIKEYSFEENTTRNLRQVTQVLLQDTVSLYLVYFCHYSSYFVLLLLSIFFTITLIASVLTAPSSYITIHLLLNYPLTIPTFCISTFIYQNHFINLICSSNLHNE